MHTTILRDVCALCRNQVHGWKLIAATDEELLRSTDTQLSPNEREPNCSDRQSNGGCHVRSASCPSNKSQHHAERNRNMEDPRSIRERVNNEQHQRIHHDRSGHDSQPKNAHRASYLHASVTPASLALSHIKSRSAYVPRAQGVIAILGLGGIHHKDNSTLPRICRCLVTQSVLERKCGDDDPEFGTNFVELSADT